MSKGKLAALAIGGILLSQRQKSTAPLPPGPYSGPRIPQGRLRGTIPSPRYARNFDSNLKRVLKSAGVIVESTALANIANANRNTGDLLVVASTPSGAGTTQPVTSPEQKSQGDWNDVKKLAATGNLVVINNDAELRNAAKLLTIAIIVLSKNTTAPLTNEVRTHLAQARKTMIWTDSYKLQLIDKVATRLFEIGGISTNDHKPLNHGVYGGSLNKWTVPQNSKDVLVAKLLKFDALDFVMELAVAEASHIAISEVRGDKTLLGEVFKSAGKVLASAVAEGAKGATGGPWGAVIGAIKGALEKAASEAFKGISDTIAQTDKEINLYATLSRAVADTQALCGNAKLPLHELGYGHKIDASNPSWMSVGAPFDVFMQRAAQSFLGITPQLQGVYPGVGMWAYQHFFGSVLYKFTLDNSGANDYRATDWWRGAKGGNKP